MRSHPLFKAYAALAAVCFFWGTTYIAIRMSLESFPPLVLISSRFLISGSIMVLAMRLKGARLPRGRDLILTAGTGVLTLGFGNGCLTLAETWIPSGLAALFITVSPFWMVGVEALLPGGERLHWPTVAGMLVGVSGAALLVAPAAFGAGLGANVLKGFLILQLGGAGWALGSILQRRRETAVHPVVIGAVQQLVTGLVFLLPAMLVPEPAIAWHGRAVAAQLYLVVFGSIVGYSAYVYALDRLPVAVASIYTYINPLVAVSLGWLFYREPFGTREAAAMAVIFLGVGLVKASSHRA